MSMQLSPIQRMVLSHAIDQTGGEVVWFPENLRGGARARVLDGLRTRGFIAPIGSAWRVTPEAYDALGLVRPRGAKPQASSLEEDVAGVKTAWVQIPAKSQARMRPDSKQAEVIKLLQRRKGATVQQICEATGWQAHTVRGFFAGALKKKLGLTLTSEKVKGGERIYRLV